MANAGRNNKDQSNYVEVAKSLGLKIISTEKAIELVMPDILLSLYRKDPQNDDDKALNDRVKQVYKRLYGTDDVETVLTVGRGQLSSFRFVGPPGHGKTTSFKVAAKRVAKEMGLNYVPSDQLTDDYVPKKDDFIFVSQEMSGEVSNMTLGGMPTTVLEVGTDGKEHKSMVKVPDRRINLLGQVAGGVFLLDDFSNASQSVRNTGLSATEEHRFQGTNLGHCYVGLTGNLGAKDGTHTTQTSVAERGRVSSVCVLDDVKNFCHRAIEAYPDDFGDVGIVGFFERNQDAFYEVPDAKEEGGYASPRTWEIFLMRSRSLLLRHNGNLPRALDDIKLMAEIDLGQDIGLKFGSYLQERLRGADPMAKQAIQEGKIDIERFKASYGGGTSEQQITFGYQFSQALGDYVVNAIANDKENKLEQPIERFGKAILMLNLPEYGYALDYMKNKLAARVDKFASTTDKMNRKTLDTKYKEKIGVIISELEDFTKQHREVLIQVISDFDKLDTSRTASAARKNVR